MMLWKKEKEGTYKPRSPGFLKGVSETKSTDLRTDFVTDLMTNARDAGWITREVYDRNSAIMKMVAQTNDANLMIPVILSLMPKGKGFNITVQDNGRAIATLHDDPDFDDARFDIALEAATLPYALIMLAHRMREIYSGR